MLMKEDRQKGVHYHNVCFHLYKVLEHAYSSIMKKGRSVVAGTWAWGMDESQRKHFGIMNILTILIVVMGFSDVYICQNITLYRPNICSLLCINCTSTKLKANKKGPVSSPPPIPH